MLPFSDNIAGQDQMLVWGFALVNLAADHVLVACQLLGLLATLPGLNGSVLPWHLKAILVLVLAAIIAPNVSLNARTMADLSALHQQSLPAGNPTIQKVSHAERELSTSYPIDGQASAPVQPRKVAATFNSSVDFLGLAIRELCLGLLLGIGAYSILQGFRMAGQLIDQQTGWGLISSQSFHDAEVGTASGELLFWLGMVLLFIMGGHLLLISTLLETFRTLPPGVGDQHVQWLPMLSQFVGQALRLTVQLSAPMIATQVLAGLVVSHASSMSPQFQQSGSSVSLKLIIATFVLLLTLSGLADRMLDAFPACIQPWTHATASPAA